MRLPCSMRIGLLPDPASVRLEDLDAAPEGLDALFKVDADAWEAGQAAVGAYLERYAASGTECSKPYEWLPASG